MNLAELVIFQAIARAGSITAGARDRQVSQSTASAALASLEGGLGTTLFQRTRSGVVLTEAGALLLDRVDGLFASIDQIEAEIRELEDEDVGRFVLGCHDALGSYFLPGFLGSFFAACPRVELSLWNRASAEVRQAVIARQVHFGLVVNTEPHDDLVIVNAFLDRIQVFGPTALPAEQARQALAAGTLVYPDREPFTALLALLRDHGCQFGRLVPCGDLGLTKTLARSLGFGLLPRRVALDGGGLVALDDSLPRWDDVIHLVYRADLPRTRAARRLQSALLAHARAL